MKKIEQKYESFMQIYTVEIDGQRMFLFGPTIEDRQKINLASLRAEDLILAEDVVSMIQESIELHKKAEDLSKTHTVH
jgi:hypothetical protein